MMGRNVSSQTYTERPTETTRYVCAVHVHQKRSCHVNGRSPLSDPFAEVFQIRQNYRRHRRAGKKACAVETLVSARNLINFTNCFPYKNCYNICLFNLTLFADFL